MTKGIVIYAHNHRAIDYALMATISGGLAKKHLQEPVSLITDEPTVAWMKESKIYNKATDVFENIIIVEEPKTNNSRNLHDGEDRAVVPFINTNRYSVWELTPYDRTLLIDADFLIFSNKLKEYWDVDSELLISESINDIYDQKRIGYHDQYVSDIGVKLYWATTVMFTKTKKTKMFFDLVNYIKEYYQYFADAYRFDSKQYRNDIAFSIAKHITDGFEESNIGRLPPVLTLLDRDILCDIKNEKLIALISPQLNSNFCVAAVSNTDIHIMNKQSIIRNKEKLLGLL